MNFTTPQFTHSVTRNFVTLKNDYGSEIFPRIYHCPNIMEQPHLISWKMLENLSHARYVSKWVVTIQEQPHGQAHSLLLARGRKEPGNIGGFKLLNSSTWKSGSSNRLHDWTTVHVVQTWNLHRSGIWRWKLGWTKLNLILLENSRGGINRKSNYDVIYWIHDFLFTCEVMSWSLSIMLVQFEHWYWCLSLVSYFFLVQCTWFVLVKLELTNAGCFVAVFVLIKTMK